MYAYHTCIPYSVYVPHWFCIDYDVTWGTGLAANGSPEVYPVLLHSITGDKYTRSRFFLLSISFVFDLLLLEDLKSQSVNIKLTYDSPVSHSGYYGLCLAW